MATHRNDFIARELKDNLKNKTGDFVSNQVSDVIQPTLPIHHAIVVVRFSNSTAGSTALYTTENDSEKDFYLMTAQLSMQADAASDAIDAAITVGIDNARQAVFEIAKITLTARSADNNISFGPRGIKLDKNSAILMAHNGAVGVTRVAASITGYYA